MEKKIDYSQFVNSNGVLSVKKLNDFLYPKPKTKKVKSVLSMNARATTLSVNRTDLARRVRAVNTAIQEVKNKDRLLYYCILLMYRHALRVSEVLNIMPNDILLNGSVIIHSLKGSSKKNIYVDEVACYLLKCKNNNTTPFERYNRWYIYRQLKKYNISYISSSSSKLSITHAFRHLKIEELRSIGLTDIDIAEITGHKNVKNLQYYGYSKKK